MANGILLRSHPISRQRLLSRGLHSRPWHHRPCRQDDRPTRKLTRGHHSTFLSPHGHSLQTLTSQASAFHSESTTSAAADWLNFRFRRKFSEDSLRYKTPLPSPFLRAPSSIGWEIPGKGSLAQVNLKVVLSSICCNLSARSSGPTPGGGYTSGTERPAGIPPRRVWELFSWPAQLPKAPTLCAAGVMGSRLRLVEAPPRPTWGTLVRVRLLKHRLTSSWHRIPLRPPHSLRGYSCPSRQQSRWLDAWASTLARYVPGSRPGTVSGLPRGGHRFRGAEYRSASLPVLVRASPIRLASLLLFTGKGLTPPFVVELFAVCFSRQNPGACQAPAGRCCHRPTPDASAR